jgi:hypothetical protein
LNARSFVAFRHTELPRLSTTRADIFLRVGNFEAAEKAIRRVISVMDKIEELSDYEKSDYLGTLAPIGGRGAALHGLAPLPPYL